MVQSLTIPGRLAGLNEYTRACRAHWAVGRKMKREQQDLVACAIAAKRITPFANPVEIQIRWLEPNNRRDADNIYFAQKFVLDALVEQKILPNDSEKWVKRISHERGLDKNNPRVEVTIREI